MLVRTRSLLRLLTLLALAGPASAATLIDSPQNADMGSFRHNAIHSAEGSGGAGGAILAWMDLDLSLGAANSWDLGTGVFSAEFVLFSDNALTTQIGSASVVGNVPAATFADAVEQNSIEATLTWDYDLTLTGSGDPFFDYLESTLGPMADSIWEGIVHQFADVQYVTSPAGFTANTFDGTNLTLWGADGAFSGSSLLPGGNGGFGGFGNTAKLGTDLVVTIPEPSVSLLGLAGILGLALWTRGARRR